MRNNALFTFQCGKEKTFLQRVFIQNRAQKMKKQRV